MPRGDCTKNPGYSTDVRPNITNRANFDEVVPSHGKNKKSLLIPTLAKQPDGVTYVWDSADPKQNPNATQNPTFFDPTGPGWVDAGKGVNPQAPAPQHVLDDGDALVPEYQGGEQFQFSGDDDTWVFVNGRLALDLGRLHVPRSGTVSLAESGGRPSRRTCRAIRPDRSRSA